MGVCSCMWLGHIEMVLFSPNREIIGIAVQLQALLQHAQFRIPSVLVLILVTLLWHDNRSYCFIFGHAHGKIDGEHVLHRA